VTISSILCGQSLLSCIKKKGNQFCDYCCCVHFSKFVFKFYPIIFKNEKYWKFPTFTPLNPKYQLNLICYQKPSSTFKFLLLLNEMTSTKKNIIVKPISLPLCSKSKMRYKYYFYFFFRKLYLIYTHILHK